MNLPYILLMAGGEGGGGGLGGMLFPMILIFGIFYFMLIRPQQRKEKERRKMIEDAKVGDRVLFSGGILGEVSQVKTNTFIIKVADSVRIEAARGAVTKILQEGETVVKDDEK